MESLSLETLDEMNYLLNTCHKHEKLFDQFTHIGGMTTVGKSLDKWYWVSTGKRVDFPLKFTPGQPDFYAAVDFCLSLEKRADGFYFADIYCQGAYELKFVCQRNEF